MTDQFKKMKFRKESGPGVTPGWCRDATADYQTSSRGESRIIDFIEMLHPIIRRYHDPQKGGIRVQKASEREMTTQITSRPGVNPTSHPERQFASCASCASAAQDAQDASNNFC